ncbi:DUF6602 domain-containing protein [Bifidobacterium aquikefiri]|uniref:DUF6602 domain-containing protein n=1 Tax=Bifidobacterium aquikefiri TaxID=1653207 RepID=UPI0039E8E99A
MNDAEPQNEVKDSRLSRVLADTTRRLQSEFNEIRDSLDHNGTVGQGGEDVVTEFLRSRLPRSIGISTGQILDVNGKISKQVDVILYDAEHTPMLFSTKNEKISLVPAEGVLGVVEVKTHLRSRDIEICLANCRSVKQLVRTAYFPQAIQATHSAYGEQWVDPPIYYTVFAASSDNLYAGHLNEIQEDVPIDERIDSLCCLDRGININVGLDLSKGIEHLRTVFSARSLSKGGMADSTTSNPLLIWYAMLASSIMQFSVRPIDVTKYMEKDLNVSAQIPDGQVSRAMYDEAVVAFAQNQGLEPDLLRKVVTPGARLSARECYKVLRAPGYTPRDDLNAQELNALKVVQRLAKELTFEQWDALKLISFSGEEHS